MATFSDRMNELLKSHNIPKKELASKMFVVPQTVSRWTNNQIIPDRAMLEKLSDFFGVDIDYLLGNCDNPNGNDLDLDSVIEQQNAFTTLIESIGYHITTEKTQLGLHPVRSNEFCKEFSTNSETLWILTKDSIEKRLSSEQMNEIKKDTLKQLDILIRKE